MAGYNSSRRSPRHAKIVKALLEGEKNNARFQKHYIHKNGTKIWTDVSVALLRDQLGKPLHFITTIVDISEQKRAEEALTRSENKYRSLFDTMSDGVIYENPEGQIISANPAAERLLGLSLDQMQGRSSLDPRWEAIHEDGSPFPGETHSLHIAAKTGKPSTGEIMGIFKPDSGTYIWLSVNSTPEFLPGEKLPFRAYAVFRDITERKRMEDQLFISESVMRALLDGIPESAFLLDLDGTIIEANITIAQRLNLEKEKIIGSNIFESVPKELADFRRKFFNQAVNTGKPVRFQDIRFDRIIDNCINPVFDRNGNVTWLAIIGIDITERVQAENAIRESRELLSYAFNKSPLMITQSDILTGKYLEVNDSFCSASEFSREEIIGKTAIELGWITKDERMVMMQNVQHDGWTKGMEVSLRSKNGKNIIGRYWGTVIHSAQGDRLFSTAEDITARKQMEEKLKESENHSRSIIEAIPDLMFVLNSEGVYLDFKADVSDLAYQKESIIGKKNRDMMSSDFADLIDEKIKTTLKSGSTQQFEYHLDVPQKGICYFEARMVPCENDRVLAIVRNITERKISEAKILEINNQLIELNATKDKFFNIIAHDLKSPFNSIVGFSDILIDMAGNNDYSQMGKYAGIIHQSSHRAIDLLMNLMEWARSQTGRIEFNPEIFEMDDLIDDVVKLLSDNAVQKKITISKKLSTRGIAKADKAMISTVLRNLIANAIKFTKPGGEITLSVRENNSGLTVAVKDNGIGIPARLTGKLFRLDESFTTRGTEKEQGTGLGLILCKEFIEKHGCKIWVESEEGIGSTFYFTVPCHAESGKERN